MEKISILWKTIKDTWNYSLQKKKKFWEDAIMKYPEKWLELVEQSLFNKVPGENENCVICFYSKTKGSFWPTQ